MMLALLFVGCISKENDPKDYREKDRKPIRILLDSSVPEKKTDPFQCLTDWQQISWKYGNYTCFGSDIIDDNKKGILNKVLPKVVEKIQSMVSLNRNTCNHSLISVDSNKIVPPVNTFNQDLYISVFHRPLGNFKAAVGEPIGFSATDSRPIQAALYISIAGMPSDPNETAEIDLFQDILLKELIRILGFDSSVFSKWLNRETGLPWGSAFPLTKYTNPSYPSIPFYVLHTPLAKKYASERFNRTEYAPGIPMGVELEVKSNGECDAKVNSRVYFSELLSGTQSDTYVLSDLTMTILEDMGWYSTVFSKASPLLWGRGESLGESKMSTFPVGKPQIDFPSHYTCQPRDFNRTTTCSYDHSSLAFCWDLFVSKVHCPGAPGSDDEKFCNGQAFFNPLNLTKRGSNFNEAYTLFKSSSYQASCFKTTYEQEPYAVNLSMKFGQDSSCIETYDVEGEQFDNFSGCYETQCDSTNTIVTVKIADKSYQCTNAGEIVSIAHPHIRSFVCPNPKIICNSKKYRNTVFSNPERIEMPGDRFYRQKIYVISGVGGILLLSIIGFIYYKTHMLKNEQSEYAKV